MGDFCLQPLRTLSDLEDAKRAARHFNDHSLAKIVTRKKKVRKSKKEAFQSVLLAARSCQESIPPKSVVSRTSTEDQECSSKPCQKRQIQLFVNSSLTSPVCLQLHPSTTVSALKGLLQDKVGIEPEKQHLFTRKNHELRDELSLANYGIEQDTNIELRLVSGLMGGDDKQKTAGRKKTKRGQKKCTSTEEVSRQSNSDEERQVRSTDESGHSPTSLTTQGNASNQPTERKKTKRSKKSEKKSTYAEEINRQSDSDEEGQVRSTDKSEDSPTTTSDQSTGRKKRKRRRRQKHVEKEPSCEEREISTTPDQDDSSNAGGSATHFGKLNLFLWILWLPLITIHVILSIWCPRILCPRIWCPRMIQVTFLSKDGTNRSRRTSSGAEKQENPDDSLHSSTSAAKLGRKRTRWTRRRQGKARRNPLLDEAERQTTSDDEKQDHLNDLGKSDTSAGKPGKIRSRGKTKKKSGKTRKGKKVAMKSSSEEEAIDKTSKGDQAEDKLVNSRDSTASSSAKTTAKRNNQSKGRKRTRRRRHGKARQKLLFHEAEKQTSSDDEKRDPSNALGKVHRRGKTKTYSGKRRKAQNVAKKSSSKEEAIDKTSTGDEAENKLVNSRDSTVSSSAKTTAKRNNQPKGRKKTKKQTNADKKPSCEEKKESQIQLFVISSLRSPVCLQLHPSTTISALKGLLQEKMGIEPKKQRLYTRRNHELKGRMSLKELGIQQDTNIELRLVSGLMGGADDEQKSAGDSRERTDSESGRRQKGRRKKGKRKATQRRTSQGAAENVDHSDVCSISSAVKAPTGNPSVQTQEEKLEQPKKKNDSRRRRRGKRKATKRTGPGGEENDENSEHSSSSSAVKTPTGHPSGETHERKPEQPKKDNDSGKRQKVKATKTWTTLGGEDDSEDSLKSSAVKASAGNPSGETPEQNLEQPCKDNDSGRRHKEKRKATKTGTSLVDEYNSEDSSISSSVKASAGQPSGETQVQQKPEQPRKENNSRRRHKGKRKAIKTRTSLGDEDNSENSSIPSAVKAAAGHPSGETQTQKLKKTSKSNSGRIQNTKTKAAETKTSLGGEENVNNLEESSISSAVKAPADHPSEETQEQRLEQSWKDNESGRRQNGDKKGTVTGTSHGGEENVGNSEDSSISSTVKAGASNLSGETEEQKLQQPRKDNDSGSRQQGERQATKKRTSLVGEDNSEDSFISSGVKAPAGHPSGQAREDKLEQPRKDNDSGIIQKGKRKATKTRTSSEREENSDNSEESSTSTAAKEPAVCQSGETQTKKQEKPRKDINSRRIQQGKRTAAKKSPSEVETNTESLGDTKQQILRDPGDSSSSATVGTAASASSETVAGSRMKRERLETAGSEAEESQQKTVGSDRQQVDTGSSPVSASVTASPASRSRGRRRTRRKRENAEKKPAEDGGDSQVLDLDRPQPEDQNVAGAMKLNMQQGKGIALEQQRPKDQITEEAGIQQETLSSETQGLGQQDYGPDRLKADLDRHQKHRPQSSQLQTMTSPEHSKPRCKQDDGPDTQPQFKNQETKSQKAKQEPVKQSCQQGLTVPERQAVRQEQIIETERPQREQGFREHGFQQVGEASPGQIGYELSSQQEIEARENQGIQQTQASRHAQLPQQDKHKVAEVSKQNTQQSTSPEHQRMKQERDDDLYGPDPKIQSTIGEQRPQKEVMTSAQEKPQPDQLHKGNLSAEQMQAVRDLVPSAVQPAMQHPSTLCTPTPDSIQPTVQTGDVNVPGSCNPVFLGSSSGHTFHYEFNQNVTVHQGATSGGMENDQHPGQHIQPEVSSPSVQTSQDTSPATDAAADAAADLCEEALKKVYKTTGSYVQLIPWVDDDMRHIMDIYTKLRLVTNELEMIKKGYEDGEEVTYEGAFLIKNEDGVVINRIIYEGLAGLGKTTLIGKIAHDWATISSGPLAKYKLVFVLRMSALQQTADLVDSLYEQLIDPNIIDKKHLKNFIFKNPKRVLILLDGFDELMTTQLDSKSFGSILQILNRKVGADIDVVITTRTSHYDTLVSRSRVRKAPVVKPFTHVKVLGFSEKDVENYLGKFFSKSPHDAETLFQVIKSSAVLFDLAHSPMLLLLMCLLWRQLDSTLPNTISRLYGAFQKYMFKRKGIPEEEIPEILVAIGKVAFHGLVSPLQRLSFQEREFEKSVLDKALKAGILTSQRVLVVLEAHNNIQFIHKTIQEFCAAVYLQSLQKSDSDEFQKNFDELDDMEKFHYLLRFCCGDNEACTIKVLQMLPKWIRSRDMWSKTKVSIIGLNCYFESQAKNLLSDFFMDSVITKTIRLNIYYRGDDVNSLVWFLKHITNQAQCKMYLAKVEELNFSHHSLERCSKDLAVAMSSMPNICRVRMESCSLPNNSMTHIASSLGKACMLYELDLSHNKALRGSVHSWMPLLYKTRLRTLKLGGCSLTVDDMKLIALSLIDMPYLMELSSLPCLSIRRKGDGIGMYLRELSLNGTEMKLILKALVYKKYLLVELCMKEIEGLQGTAALWTSQFKELKQLDTLTFERCTLTSVDVKLITESLCDTPTLTELNLSQNYSKSDIDEVVVDRVQGLGGTAAEWEPALQLKYLKQLHLQNCFLKVEDVKWIASAVGCLPRPIRCTVDRVFQISPFFKGLDIKLSSQMFTGSDVVGIVKAMCSLNDIVQVVVKDAKGLRDTATVWLPALQELKGPERLAFLNRLLPGRNITPIVATLSTYADHLHMSGNHLAGSGVSLSKVKQLNVLTLDGCNLEMEDEISIATVIGCLPKVGFCCHFHGLDELWFDVVPRELGIGIRLRLGWCNEFRGPDVANIVRALGRRLDLVDVTVEHNTNLSGKAAEWSAALQTLEHLKRFRISNSSLIDEDIKHITASLSDIPTLVELDLSRNVSLAGSSAWSHLKCLKQLKKLVLKMCRLSDADIELIAEPLSGIPTLVELDLSRNVSLAGSSAWSHLKRLKQLKKLVLKRCWLTYAVIEAIAASLSDIPTLVELDLSRNVSLAGSSAWSHLKCLKQLQKLELRWCALRNADIELIAASLSEMSNLLELDLSGNEFLAGTSAWSHLKCSKQLKKLVLKDCWLTDAVFKVIAASLSDIPTLVELDLSGNEYLGYSDAWSHLKRLKQLKKLSLGECALSDADIQLIAASLSSVEVESTTCESEFEYESESESEFEFGFRV